MALIDLTGYCPMGCGRTLHFDTSSGFIACKNHHCPRPLAVSDLLSTDRTDHKVEVSWGGFAIKHPLFERIEDRLFECDLQKWFEGLDGPPVSEGTYSVQNISGPNPPTGTAQAVVDGWAFTEIEEEL